MNTFEKEILSAQEVLTTAGEIALSYFNKNPEARIKADNTPVTEADIAIENSIKEALLQKFPSYGFLGEETEENVKDISWIVDPIDGTLAFARGLPGFSIVLALAVEKDVVISFVYLPLFNVFYRAEKGKGSFKNNEQIFVSKVEDLHQAIISFDRKTLLDRRFVKHFTQLMEEYKITAGEHAGVASAYIAQGSFDVLVKPTQKIWDLAPEQLLMKEAGAMVTDEYGDPLSLTFSKDSRSSYIATTPSLSQKYKDLLYFEKKNS